MIGRARHRLSRFEQAFSRSSCAVISWLLVAGLALLFVNVLLLILLRYAFKTSIIGLFEMTIVLFIYLSSMGIVMAFIQREHIAVSVLFNRMSVPGKRVVLGLNCCLVMALSALLGWYSLGWIGTTGKYPMETTGLPQWVQQITIPLSSFWIALVALLRLLVLLFDPNEALLKMGETEDGDEDELISEELEYLEEA